MYKSSQSRFNQRNLTLNQHRAQLGEREREFDLESPENDVRKLRSSSLMEVMWGDEEERR